MLPFELTKDTPYLALSGELWSVFYEYFNRNWPCYKGFLLYVLSLVQLDAVITLFSITQYWIPHCNDLTLNTDLWQTYTFVYLPYWTQIILWTHYRQPLACPLWWAVRCLEKIDPVIKAPHCILNLLEPRMDGWIDVIYYSRVVGLLWFVNVFTIQYPRVTNLKTLCDKMFKHFF